MKKVLSLLLVFVLAISVFTGCKKETPKEALQKGFENSLNIKTSQSSFDMTLNFDFDASEAPDQAFLLQMINGSTVKGEFTSDIDKMELAGQLVLDMNGMSYTSDIFSTPEKVVLKVPMMNKYLIMDQNMSADDQDKQKEDMKKLNTEVMDTLLSNIKDENIKVLEKEKISTPEGEVEVTGYAITFNNDEMMKVMDDLLSYLFKNEIFRNSMKNSIKNQAKLEGEELSDEEVDAKVKEAEEEMNKAITEMKEHLTFDSLEVIYGLDKDYNVRSSSVKGTVSIKDDENIQNPISIKFDVNSQNWNINKPVKIEIPELNEENSMKMEELSNQFPMGVN